MLSSRPRRAVGAALLLLGLLAAPALLFAQEVPPAKPPVAPAPPATPPVTSPAPTDESGDDVLDRLVGMDESDAKAVEIIDRYIEAIGGRETLSAIQDRVERFDNKKLTPTGEVVMKMNRYLARPVKIREEWEIPGMNITKDDEPLRVVQVYDGEKGWVQTFGFVDSISGSTLTMFVWDKHIDDFFATWRENGWTAKYIGPAESNGRAVEVVELVSYAGNQRVRYSFSTEEGLLLTKTWSEGVAPGVVRKEVTFDEYTRIPLKSDTKKWVRHALTQRIFEDNELALEKVYTEIVLNGGLAAATFARPEGPDYDPAEIQKRNAEKAAEGGGATIAEPPKKEEEKKPVWEKPKKPAPAPAPPKEEPPKGEPPAPKPGG